MLNPNRARLVAFAALCLLSAGGAGPASARVLEGEYSLSVRGFPIGSAQLRAQLADGQYEIELSSRLTGLVRIFSDGAGLASASGTEADGGLRPARYGHRWTEEDETETVNVAFAGSDAKTIEIDPPVKRPKRYVPVQPEHMRGVLDPATAFIWPTASEDGPRVCGRVLPVFDGKRRFDLSFTFNRQERFEARDGSYSGPAFVCSIRYTPIAGHRVKKEAVQSMAANTDMEVWMAPLGDGSHVAPVRLRVGTKYGRIVLEAKRFATK